MVGDDWLEVSMVVYWANAKISGGEVEVSREEQHLSRKMQGNMAGHSRHFLDDFEWLVATGASSDTRYLSLDTEVLLKLINQ